MTKEKKCAKKCDKKPLTKTQIIAALAEATQLGKKDVAKLVDALGELIATSLSSKGAGSFTLPGLVKIEKKRAEAVPARKNVPDPFHPGQFVDRAAKPAHNKVKVRALKALKDMVK
ncbi:MAG: HU family DNA-binding protein [Planctomycetia bacterium]|nr:HU family DNA-binding protein [Planctomycetia bacterium]